MCEFDCGYYYPDTPYLNPLEYCECIGSSAVDEITNHGLGTNCGGGVDPHACEVEAAEVFDDFLFTDD
jgi:hypothetical protein